MQSFSSTRHHFFFFVESRARLGRHDWGAVVLREARARAPPQAVRWLFLGEGRVQALPAPAVDQPNELESRKSGPDGGVFLAVDARKSQEGKHFVSRITHRLGLDTGLPSERGAALEIAGIHRADRASQQRVG